MVSIDAFQALDPGSIPGHRKLLFQISLFLRWLLFSRERSGQVFINRRVRDTNHKWKWQTLQKMNYTKVF